VHSPIPDEAPVTMTTLPWMSIRTNIPAHPTLVRTTVSPNVVFHKSLVFDRRMAMDRVRVASLLAIGLVCAACGGGGGGGATPTAYAGSYVGEFIDANGAIGQFSLVVQASNPASFTGQYIYPSSTINFAGNLAGGGQGNFNIQSASTTDYGHFQLGPSGQPTARLTFRPQPVIDLPSGGSGTTGTTGTTGGTGTTGTTSVFPIAQVVLISNPTGFFGGTNPFSGNYAGTVKDTTLNSTSILALSIDTAGSISGSGTITNNLSQLLTSVTGSLSAAGTLSYVQQADNGSGAGTVTLAKGIISGTLKLSNGDSAEISLSQVKPLNTITLPITGRTK
jgi:hypothetical protein